MATLRTVTLASLAVLAACTTVPVNEPSDGQASYDERLVTSGRQVALGQCASCHAIDLDTVSPHPEAPAFRGLLARYDSEMLTNHLIEGVRVGHDGMPVLDLDVQSADALVAYMKWLDSSRTGRNP